MSRQGATALADVVRGTTRHYVRVVPDGDFYAVEVRVEDGSEPGTFILRDEADWDWLRAQIGRRR